VTIVEWGDFECPFTRKATATMAELRGLYGPDRLRFVWKNNPLPFHKNARPAADLAMAVFAQRGATAFWSFFDAMFASMDATRGGSLGFDEIARGAGVPPAEAERLGRGGATKVDADIELGKAVGVTGTPAFFINGVFVSGAQPLDKFKGIVDEQLRAAAALANSGVPARSIYAKLAEKNKAKNPPPAKPGADVDDAVVWRVPVAGSPVRGKPTALVTMVMFGDFQCPFTAKVVPTVEALLGKYGDKLRLVWKNTPLPFHPRAEPAAELALEARAQKGDAAFWSAFDLLFKEQQHLDDSDLEGHARSLGLDAPRAMQAVAGHRHGAAIDADQDLSDDLEASGTPHFFINGRRLVGAQPIDKFSKLIDEELAKAQKLVATGTPAASVYERTQKGAKTASPAKTVSVPPPAKDSPSRGAPGARVVVQMFSEFQCPFCKKVQPTLDQLVAEFPGKVRVVWRHNPLPLHKQAMIASEAAMEAMAQKGDAAFWKMADLLWQDQSETGLSRESLDRKAAAVGLDVRKFDAALDTHKHQAAIERDQKIAEKAGLSGVPSFVINGQVLIGAQPISKFRRVVKSLAR
jgi:protein-disulfide isomerase